MIDYDLIKLAAQHIHPKEKDVDFDVQDIKTHESDTTLFTNLSDFAERYPISYHNYADNRIGTPPFLGAPIFEDDKNYKNLPQPILDLLDEINTNATIKGKIVRGHVNAQTPGMYAGPHYDFHNKQRVTVVYMSSYSDGDLVFYNNIRELKEIYRVQYKPGRYVIFPSQICHEALPPKLGFRTTIALVFEKNVY